MTRWIAELGMVFASQAMAVAHFVFVAPQKEGTIQVVLSETLAGGGDHDAFQKARSGPYKARLSRQIRRWQFLAPKSNRGLTI